MRTNRMGVLSKLIAAVIAVWALGQGRQAWAVPVLNLNASGATEITAHPDHLNPNLFYLAPTVMVVAKDQGGIPQFSYMEYGGFMADKGAIIQATLVPAMDMKKVEIMMEQIRRGNPKAVFTALVYSRSEIVFSDKVLSRMVKSSSCSHIGGDMASEQSCSFDVTQRGREVMRPMLKRSIGITAQLEYEVRGVLQNADGTYSPQTNTYGIAARIGGEELAKHDRLFLDARGRQLPGDKVAVSKTAED